MGTITTNAVRSEDTKNVTITRAARVVKRTRHFEKLSLQIIYHVTSESLYLYRFKRIKRHCACRSSYIMNLRAASESWHQVAA